MHALVIECERKGLQETEDLDPHQVAVLKALRETGVMPEISIVSENAAIDGTEGSLLVYERQDGDSTVEVMAHLGKAVSGLREQNDFALSMSPGTPS